MLENIKVLITVLALCCIVFLPLLFIEPYQGSKWTISSHKQHHVGSNSSNSTWQDYWWLRLGRNLLGYATVFLPCFLLVKYLEKTRYTDRAGSGILADFIRKCVDGKEDLLLVNSVSPTLTGQCNSDVHSYLWYGQLLGCAFGLQVTYLLWGVLQEGVMTGEYNGHRFTDSQFLVFTNRFLAGFIALLGLQLVPQPQHRAPLIQYSYFSFSNVMSSWCQYEALKFVSFPTQVLAKASKLIPVMLMGRVINRRSYPLHEYGTAALMSVGVALFLISSVQNKQPEAVTTGSGVLLLLGYMIFDSFTPNYQSALFQRYGVSSLQMMAAANFWSCLLTFFSLLEQGSLVSSILFMLAVPRFCFDVWLLSVCGALGQIFIYYTVERFGTVTFTIIMTLRQALAILLSCAIYGHPVSAGGLFGVAIVFVALFLSIYMRKVAGGGSTSLQAVITKS